MAKFSGDIVKDKALKSRYECTNRTIHNGYPKSSGYLRYEVRRSSKTIHTSIEFSMSLTLISPVYVSCRYNIRVKCMKQL